MPSIEPFTLAVPDETLVQQRLRMGESSTSGTLAIVIVLSLLLAFGCFITCKH